MRLERRDCFESIRWKVWMGARQDGRGKVKTRTLKIEGCGTQRRNQNQKIDLAEILRLFHDATRLDRAGEEKSKPAPLKPKGAAPKGETRIKRQTSPRF